MDLPKLSRCQSDSFLLVVALGKNEPSADVNTPKVDAEMTERMLSVVFALHHRWTAVRWRASHTDKECSCARELLAHARGHTDTEGELNSPQISQIALCTSRNFRNFFFLVFFFVFFFVSIFATEICSLRTICKLWSLLLAEKDEENIWQEYLFFDAGTFGAINRKYFSQLVKWSHWSVRSWLQNGGGDN